MQKMLKYIIIGEIIYIIGGCSVTNIKVRDSKHVKIKTEQHDEFKQDSLRVNIGGHRDGGNLRTVAEKKISKN